MANFQKDAAKRDLEDSEESMCQEDHEPCKTYAASKSRQIERSQGADGCCCCSTCASERPRDVAEQVLNVHNELKKVLDNGDLQAAFERWSSKSEQERVIVLKKRFQAWPQPKFLLKLAFGEISEFESVYGITLLVPYLDLEALSRHPGALFRMANLHTVKNPWEYAKFDTEQLYPSMKLNFLGVHLSKGCVRTKDQTSLTYGTVEPYDKEAIHSGQALPTHVAMFSLSARQLVLNMLLNVIRSMTPATGSKNSRKAWKRTLKADFWTPRSPKDVTRSLMGIGRLPQFDFVRHIEDVQSLRYRLEEEFCSVCTRPDVLKQLVVESTPPMEDKDNGRHTDDSHRTLNTAMLVIRNACDDLCGANLLMEESSRLAEQHESASNEKYNVPESISTIAAVIQLMLTQLLARLEKLFFASSLYPMDYRCFAKAKELYDEYDQLSGLLLGLLHDPSHITTFLPKMLLLLEREEETERTPEAIHKLLDTIDSLSHLADSIRCQQALVPNPVQAFAADDTSLVCRFYSWQKGQREQLQDNEHDLALSFETLDAEATEFGSRETIDHLYMRQNAVRQQSIVEPVVNHYLGGAHATGSFSEREIAILNNFLLPNDRKATDMVPIFKLKPKTKAASSVSAQSDDQRETFLPHQPAYLDVPTRFIADASTGHRRSNALVRTGAPKPGASHVTSDIKDTEAEEERIMLSRKDYRLVPHSWYCGKRVYPQGDVRPSDLKHFMLSIGFEFSEAEACRVDFRRRIEENEKEVEQRLNLHLPHGVNKPFRDTILTALGRQMGYFFGWDAGTFSQAGV